MARAINESRARLSHILQPNCHGIAVADRSALKTRSAFDAVGLVEQFPNRHLRFARVALPFRDRIGNWIVELEQSVARRSKRGDSPEAFCSTEDWPPSARRPAIGVMLKNCPAILHDQHGNTAFALGVFCCTRAISGLYLSTS